MRTRNHCHQSNLQNVELRLNKGFDNYSLKHFVNHIQCLFTSCLWNKYSDNTATFYSAAARPFLSVYILQVIFASLPTVGLIQSLIYLPLQSIHHLKTFFFCFFRPTCASGNFFVCLFLAHLIMCRVKLIQTKEQMDSGSESDSAKGVKSLLKQLVVIAGLRKARQPKIRSEQLCCGLNRAPS